MKKSLEETPMLKSLLTLMHKLILDEDIFDELKSFVKLIMKAQKIQNIDDKLVLMITRWFKVVNSMLDKEIN